MSEEMNIVDHLIASIQSGRYEPGDKLPSENEVADLYKVPRFTVHKAYERLHELGYLYSKQGKGSFVKDRNMHISLLRSENESFGQKMIDLGLNYMSKNAFCEPIELNNKIYESLGAEEGERVYKVGRLRLIDDQPIALHISYVRESMFPDIGSAGKDITSMFQFYRSRGYHNFKQSQSLLSIAYPAKYERELLACSSLIPLLVMETKCMDKESGLTLEYSKGMYRGDYFTYVI